MSFLDKLFGSTQKQQHPRWVEIGSIRTYTAGDPLSEFRSHAERILASIGRHGSLLHEVSISEPTPGYFGSSRQEFSMSVLQFLDQLWEPQQAFNIEPEGLKSNQTPGLSPRVRNALETDNVIFLVGITEDGRRHVALVALE